MQTGLSEGDFHRLSVLHNGDMTNIISLIGSLGGSGAAQSATTASYTHLPLPTNSEE